MSVFEFKSGDILYFRANKTRLWDRFLAWILNSDTVHCAIAYVPDPANPLMFEALPKKGGIFLNPIHTKMPNRVYRAPDGVMWNRTIENFNFNICNQIHYSLEDGLRARIGLADDDDKGMICSEHIATCMRMAGVFVSRHRMTPEHVETQIPLSWKCFDI